MSADGAGHRLLEHTADAILSAWGPDLASCAQEAVAALVDTFVAEVRPGPVEHRAIHLEPASDEATLVTLLEEVIFVLDTAALVPVGAEVHATPGRGLDAVIVLAPRDRVVGTGAVPKALSRSGLEVRVRPGHVECRLLVDL